MTRRPWLPYALWAVLVGAVVLFGQPGFSYCAELHPRLCTTALLADLSGPWDPSQGLLILVMLATGWIVIAAGQKLGRTTAVALGASSVAAIGWGLFVWGGRVSMCLGPLNVTEESCRAAQGLPPLTAWDRWLQGPGPIVAALVAGWLVVLTVRGWRRRQRGGL
jgi:hypothetical protein